MGKWVPPGGGLGRWAAANIARSPPFALTWPDPLRRKLRRTWAFAVQAWGRRAHLTSPPQGWRSAPSSTGRPFTPHASNRRATGRPRERPARLHYQIFRPPRRPAVVGEQPATCKTQVTGGPLGRIRRECGELTGERPAGCRFE
ncbi:hypothetical protein BU16DRAFT_167237 [Lophium mytilinum]|uniref:Uncharacterized protein n=1 Tax=Lophium mytilinum TaxID=390894 RepID=A0A6A6QCP2_9PEZI|nr:hypothetical protein BU16DRAFT_167237 [Lophium mytilinum]